MATLRSKPPSGDGWLHEVKYDGYRLQLQLREGAVRLLTRRGHDWSDRFESVVEAAWHLKAHAAVLDGEVVVPGEGGRTDFGALQDDLGAGRVGRVAYVAFDLLYLDGLDLRAAALVDRKSVLAELLADAAPAIRFGEHLNAQGDAVYRHACKLELEGIVSKRCTAPYRSGRITDWIKVTCRYRETFPVVGVALKAGRFDGVYLGRDENGRLRYAGKVEKGFSPESERALSARLEPVPKPPIPLPRRFPKARWVKAVVPVDVEYRGLTDEEGLLRHPSFKGIREDLLEPARRQPRQRADARRRAPAKSV